MKEVVNEEEKGGWTHGEWEVGKRLVAEEESGEEVAVREVRTCIHNVFMNDFCYYYFYFHFR